MQTITEIALEKAGSGIFTRREAACWVNNEGARLEALLKRSVAAGEVLHIRRGLFCLVAKYVKPPIHAFELAQRISGPSYISLESALAHHGWIPEAVYTVTSVSLLRSRTFQTPLGLFSYTRIPQEILFAGVHREERDGGSYFVAEPLKALADYVYAHACDWHSAAPVLESLRVDEAELATLTAESFARLEGVYRSARVCRFLEALRKELKP
ncbi:MAG: hypothetical protein WCR06_07420 [bacterium]